MKKLAIFLFAVVLILSLTACGNSTTDGENPGNATGIKDTITWAQGTDVFSFDPHIGKETTAIQVTGNIYDTLVTVDGDMNVLPMLATEWERISDLEYEFTIREGVKFHDGSPFTVEDVKFSLERAINSPQVAYITDFMEKVEIKDENTIKITTHEPYAATLLNLTHPAAGMVSKAYTESQDKILESAPMGTGPYKFVEWRQGDYVKLTAFDEYWGGKPETKNLVMRIIPENAQRTIALELGEVDVAYDILPNDVSKIKENADLAMMEIPALTSFTVAFNLSKPALENKLVREAIRLAIDSQVIVDSIYYGAGEVAHSMIPPGAFGFQKDVKIEPNLERAKELLVEAGFPDGFKTNIYVNDNQTRVEMCQVIQDQLKKIGIDMEIKVLEFGTFIEKCNAGEQDMMLAGWTTSTADADYTYFAQFHSSKFGSQGNRVFVDIPGMDALLEAARGSGDADERMDLYSQVEDILTAESIHRPLLYTTVNAGTSAKLNDFVLIPNGYHRYFGVTVNE